MTTSPRSRCDERTRPKLQAEATLLKLGRRIATADILIWTESRERAATKATVAYAIP